MKKAFTTLGCPDWSWEHVMDEAVRMGYDGLEIRGIEGEMRSEKLGPFLPGRQQDTKRALAARGLTLVGLDTSCSFHDAAKMEDALEEGRAAIDVANAMGIRYLRVFGNNVPEGELQADVLKRVAEGVAALCAYAEGTCVKVLLEVHGDFNNIERVVGVAEQITSPHFGILWDVAHSDRTYGKDWPVFYEAIQPWLCHVHFKDHRHALPGAGLVRLGHGDIPLIDILKRLKADNYPGFVSFEWEKKWHPEIEEPEVAFPDFIEMAGKV